jgi:peptidoglycan/LPS O-acetylase OafA/YrhL
LECQWSGRAFSGLGGAARILFAFPLGVLLYRLHKADRLRLIVPTPVIFSAFLATLMLPDFGGLKGAVDAAVVVLVFPMVMASAITARVSGAFYGPFAFLAVLSYPLYILHGPIVMGFAQLAGHAPVVLITAAGTSLAAAWVAARWFDDPARAALDRLLSPRPRAAARPEPG